MRHLWVIEEKGPGGGWCSVPETWILRDGVFFTRQQARDELNIYKFPHPEGYQYRITKYIPEEKK